MSLQVVKTWKVEVNEEVIAKLEEWLERAKAGEYTGLVLVGSRQDGSIDTYITKMENQITLIAGVTIAQHRMIENRHSTEVSG
jgi:predicted phosphoadenosine phosphosulfate sulfurtransferase